MLVLPAADGLNDTYAQIRELGAATGHADEAPRSPHGMKADINGIVEDVPVGDEPADPYSSSTTPTSP